MTDARIPQLLRSPDLGLFLLVDVGRKWARVITRDAREVTLKKVRNEVVLAAEPVDYQPGVAMAAERFLRPGLGIMVVTTDAKHILEDIMKIYSTKAAAKKGLERMVGDTSRFDEVVTQVGGKWHLEDAAHATPPTTNVEPASHPVERLVTFTVVGDQTKRRGDFGVICAAITRGHNTWAKISEQVPTVPMKYIKQATAWGMRNGVLVSGSPTGENNAV